VTRRLVLCVLALALAAGLAGTMAGAGVTRPARDGGTFRVVSCTGGLTCFDYIDPALAQGFGTTVQATFCGSLMRYPDKPPPAGYRLVPELAASFPRISRDGRTYTFRIRKGVRFSTGTAVTGESLAHALDRILDPKMQSPLSGLFTGVVGAQEVLDGKTKHPSGVKASRSTISFRLTHPDGGFLDLLSVVCAVPSNLPDDPEGAAAPLPSAGPYYPSEYIPGRRLVLVRNRFYRGPRPHHVARFEFDLQKSPVEILDEVKAGKADWGFLPAGGFASVATDFARRYGVNKSRFFVHRGLFLRLFHMNTSSPLFRDNARLRRAVSFAVERKALADQMGPYAARPTDHYLSPDHPGYRRVRIYPLVHPNLARARALARGHTRSGKAVVYVPNSPIPIAQAQILQRDLKRIGLELTIEQFTVTVLFEKLATPGEPFDFGWVGWSSAPDPNILDCLFNGKWIGTGAGCNRSYFNSPRYNARLNAANRLTGTARKRAFGRLDVELARDAAPAIAFAQVNTLTFVSSRTGCVVLNPNLDLTAVCLKS
jgi:peptide/nickel transport system substrate-binding protein